jgi:hypothetical protein
MAAFALRGVNRAGCLCLGPIVNELDTRGDIALEETRRRVLKIFKRARVVQGLRRDGVVLCRGIRRIARRVEGGMPDGTEAPAGCGLFGSLSWARRFY